MRSLVSAAWILAFVGACASAPVHDEATAGGAGEPSGGLSGNDGGSAGSSGGNAPVAGSSTEAGRTGRAGSGTSGEAGQSAGGSAGTEVSLEPESAGIEVELETPNQAARAELETTLSSLDGIDRDELRELYPSRFVETLGYDPAAALGLDAIQDSPLSLDENELALLGDNGFVITDRQSFPTFTDGYAAIYGAHLPLYVSADSILNATHRSYDKILQSLEETVLVPSLGRLLERLRSALAAGAADDFGATAVADADVYLTVAQSLLDGDALETGAGGSQAQVNELYERCVAAEDWSELLFLGVQRHIDFSQFTPRGHYTGDVGGPVTLERYFRSMMWLGMMDLRLIETQDDGSQLFLRRQLELAYALRALYDDTALGEHRKIDSVVRAFVGEADNMTLEQLGDLLEDLELDSPAGLSAKSDQELAQAILDGGYGAQQISGQILINGTGGTIPLSSTFLLLGRRYVVDSHVFSNVVYGRVPERNGRLRMLPNPLDVAFAALENNQAGALLDAELETYSYAPELAKTRALVDAHPQSFWDANLYNGWLDALRALSPPADLGDPAALGLPAVAGTEAWGRRILNTQLASWAELRHDTVLYAKQSYTDVPACEFPDGYVDPYPDFYAKLGAYAERGQALVADLGLDANAGADVLDYFDNLAAVAATLQGLAEHQQSGMPFTDEQVAFLNRAVSDRSDCFYNPDGWYPRLVFRGLRGDTDTEFDPPITDVHTQPADESGVPVGRVLHVATGLARLMVVTTNTCTGARAYVGLASSYFERVTEDFERLKDEEWAAEVMAEAPEDVPWMQDLVAR